VEGRCRVAGRFKKMASLGSSALKTAKTLISAKRTFESVSLNELWFGIGEWLLGYDSELERITIILLPCLDSRLSWTMRASSVIIHMHGTAQDDRQI